MHRTSEPYIKCRLFAMSCEKYHQIIYGNDRLIVINFLELDNSTRYTIYPYLPGHFGWEYVDASWEKSYPKSKRFWYSWSLLHVLMLVSLYITTPCILWIQGTVQLNCFSLICFRNSSRKQSRNVNNVVTDFYQSRKFWYHTYY